jgi:hypothetical protein
LSDDLTERIEALSREEVLEAALAVGQDAETDGSDPEVQQFLASVEAEPFAAVAEVEELARLSLLLAADDPELRPTVEEAVDAVGKKAFIFGGAEILIAGTLTLGLLHMLMSRGRLSEKETEVTYDENGRPVVRHREVVYGVSSGITGVLKALVGKS